MPGDPDSGGTRLRTGGKRREKVVSLAAAGKMIAGCRSVHLAGDPLFDAPMALVREAVRAGAKGLTLIPTVATGIAADLLIAAGRVDTVYLSYIGFEGLGMAPAFRRAVEQKTLRVVDGDEAFVVLGTRAAASGLPFIAVPRHVYAANDLPTLNHRIKTLTDPYTGDEVYAIPPLKADICLLHAQQADVFGNTRCLGGNRQEPDKAKASGIVIVSAEELVSVDEIRSSPEKTTLPGHMVDAVVHVPCGAHPTGASRCYAYDAAHIRMYRELVSAGDAGAYLRRFVFEAADHDKYLKKIGQETLEALRRELQSA